MLPVSLRTQSRQWMPTSPTPPPDCPAFHLPYPPLHPVDQNALRVLLALYRGPAGRDIPPEALYMKWQNRRGHLSLLRVAILAPPQVFTFASSPSKQAPLDGVDPGAATPNGAWLSLDLVAALLSLASDTELYAQVGVCGARCGFLGIRDARNLVPILSGCKVRG